jgi:hypothetical protein
MAQARDAKGRFVKAEKSPDEYYDAPESISGDYVEPKTKPSGKVRVRYKDAKGRYTTKRKAKATELAEKPKEELEPVRVAKPSFIDAEGYVPSGGSIRDFTHLMHIFIERNNKKEVFSYSFQSNKKNLTSKDLREIHEYLRYKYREASNVEVIAIREVYTLDNQSELEV